VVDVFHISVAVGAPCAAHVPRGRFVHEQARAVEAADVQNRVADKPEQLAQLHAFVNRDGELQHSLLLVSHLPVAVDQTGLVDGGRGMVGEGQEVNKILLRKRPARNEIIDGDEADDLPARAEVNDRMLPNVPHRGGADDIIEFGIVSGQDIAWIVGFEKTPVRLVFRFKGNNNMVNVFQIAGPIRTPSAVYNRGGFVIEKNSRAVESPFLDHGVSDPH